MPRPVDDLVYRTTDGRLDYVASFEEGPGGFVRWYRWPAEAGGWAQRASCSATLAEECSELPPRLARLALRLSGVALHG